MSILTKASLASFFEVGDKPTEAQFQHLFDTMVAVPTAATFPCFIEVEGTVSSTSRPVGAVGRRLVEASATTQARNALGITSVAQAFLDASTTASALERLSLGSAPSVVGVQLLQASTTAAARNLLNITAGASAGAAGQAIVEAGTTVAAQRAMDVDRDSISGFITGPQARLYTLDRRARFAYSVDWFAAIASAGHCQVTLLSDSSVMTGLASASIDITEVATSVSAVTQSIAVGESLNLRVSDTSAPDALAFTIGITRT